MTSRPLSIARPTFAPGCKRRISSSAGGTASMTDPPTLRRLVVCIRVAQKLYPSITSQRSREREIATDGHLSRFLAAPRRSLINIFCLSRVSFIAPQPRHIWLRALPPLQLFLFVRFNFDAQVIDQ